MDIKACCRCGEVKPLDEFVKDNRKAGGYGTRCKVCHNAMNRDLYHQDIEASRARNSEKRMRLYYANPERYREQHREWYSKNREHAISYTVQWGKDHLEEKRANGREYYYRHADVIKARVSEWVDGHREQHYKHTRRWKAAHVEKVRSMAATRRARRVNAPIVESFDRREIWERDGGLCHICGGQCDSNNWHLDHIVPLIRGGNHSRANVAVAHPNCNLRKWAHMPGEVTV